MESLEARKHDDEEKTALFWGPISKTLGSTFDEQSVLLVLSEAIRAKQLLLQAIENVRTLLKLTPEEVEKWLDKENAKYKANVQSFMMIAAQTLSHAVMLEYTMLSQQDLITAYLEEKGFKDVRIERRTSAVNGRNNSWIICAIIKNGKVLVTEKKPNAPETPNIPEK
jgi:hypothetical protein